MEQQGSIGLETDQVIRAIISTILLIIVGGSLLLISCGREQKEKQVDQRMEEHGMPVDWKFTLPTGDPVEGRKIFVDMECYKCHEVKGETFPTVAAEGGAIGPELSQTAAMHPVEFFAESIINPNAVIDPEDKAKGYLGEDGRSKMLDYNDLLTAKQLVDLAAYLAAPKASKHTAY